MQLSIVELSLAVMVQRAVMGALVLGIYGFVLTLILAAAGDRGPRDDGRLTLDPFAHLSLLGVAALVVAKIGWILPLHSDSRQLRGGVLSYIACLLLAGLAMVVLAYGFGALRPLALLWFSHSSAIYAISLLNIGVDLALGIGIGALLPLPPFMLGQLWQRLARRFAPQASARQGQIDALFGVAILCVLLLMPSRFAATVIAMLRSAVGL